MKVTSNFPEVNRLHGGGSECLTSHELHINV